MKFSIDLSSATDDQLHAFADQITNILITVDSPSEILNVTNNEVLLELQKRGDVKGISKPV